MQDFLHSLKEIPKGLNSSNPHTFNRKIEQATANLQRVQRVTETQTRDGHTLNKGELYLEPHRAAVEKQRKEPQGTHGAYVVPMDNPVQRDDFLFHLGRASAYLEMHSKAGQPQVQPLHAEVRRVLDLLQKH